MSKNPDFSTAGRVMDFRDWNEKIVRCVIDRPSGRRGHDVAAVVVFEDDTWSTLAAQTDGLCGDDGYLSLGSGGGLGHRITDFLSAQDLLQARMVNQAQFEYLKAQEDIARKADLLQRAEKLRAEAEKALATARQMDVAAQS